MSTRRTRKNYYSKHLSNSCEISRDNDAPVRDASTEGFNNKIRWLIRQAYGFREDIEYFRLKIYQLPEIHPQRKHYDFLSETVEEAKKKPKTGLIWGGFPFFEHKNGAPGGI